MTPELEAFLTSEDLDEIQKARGKIEGRDVDDEAVIRAVLEQWQNHQAVSNLLLHPDLIPDDIRLETLFRGLYEQQVGYYVLASVIGFQSLDVSEMADVDRRRVLSDLLVVMRETTGILAKRASISFREFANVEDASQVFALIGHTDMTVRHNLRAWLFQTFAAVGTEALAVVGHESGVNEEMQRQIVKEFDDFLTNPSNDFSSPLCPLFGYIPNLRDIA